MEYNAEPISDEDSIDRRQGRRPTPDFEFRCWVAPDMSQTEFENKNKSWFHFKVQGASGKCIRFNMMNLNKHHKLFNQGNYYFMNQDFWSSYIERFSSIIYPKNLSIFKSKIH